jgi:hypothetical protein
MAPPYTVYYPFLNKEAALLPCVLQKYNFPCRCDFYHVPKRGASIYYFTINLSTKCSHDTHFFPVKALLNPILSGDFDQTYDTVTFYDSMAYCLVVKPCIKRSHAYKIIYHMALTVHTD